MIYRPQYVKVRPKLLKDKKIARQANAVIDWQYERNLKDIILYGIHGDDWKFVSYSLVNQEPVK